MLFYQLIIAPSGADSQHSSPSPTTTLPAPASESERVADCSGQRKLPGAGQALDRPSESGQTAGELRFCKPNLFKNRGLSLVAPGTMHPGRGWWLFGKLLSWKTTRKF